MFAHLYILGFRPEDSQPGNNQCLHPACLTLTPEIIWSFKVFVHSLKISFDTPQHLETSQVLISEPDIFAVLNSDLALLKQEKSQVSKLEKS